MLIPLRPRPGATRRHTTLSASTAKTVIKIICSQFLKQRLLQSLYEFDHSRHDDCLGDPGWPSDSWMASRPTHGRAGSRGVLRTGECFDPRLLQPAAPGGLTCVDPVAQWLPCNLRQPPSRRRVPSAQPFG